MLLMSHWDSPPNPVHFVSMSNVRKRSHENRLPQPPKRPGDHYYVAVDFYDRVSTSGETAAELGVALAAAPVPERKYVADVCYLSDSITGAKIVFGQQAFPATERLRSAVVVKMSRRGVGFLLRSIDAVTDPSYAQIAEKLRLKPIPVSELTAEPEQVVMLAANAAVSAMSGEEASVDFLQMSPFAMVSARRGAREIPVDPVVRIDLSSETFLGLIEALRALPNISREMALGEDEPKALELMK